MSADPSNKGFVGADARRLIIPPEKAHPSSSRLLRWKSERRGAGSRCSSEARAAAILALICLLPGCGEKPRSNAWDFSKSNSVSVVLGEAEKEYGNGLQHVYFEQDGFTTAASRDGVPCRSLRLEGNNFGYLYFIIDPTFKKRSLKNARIDVEFLDEKAGVLGLQFDATGSKKMNEPAYAEADGQIQLTGSRTWQTATFHVHGATFKNRQNSRSDFRLCVSPPELYLRQVTLTRDAKGAFLNKPLVPEKAEPLAGKP